MEADDRRVLENHFPFGEAPELPSLEKAKLGEFLTVELALLLQTLWGERRPERGLARIQWRTLVGAILRQDSSKKCRMGKHRDPISLTS